MLKKKLILQSICLLNLCVLFSCNAQDKTLTIFSKGEDSIFYYSGKDFEVNKLKAGVMSDPAFTASLHDKIKNADTILYKPVSSGGGRLGLKLTDFKNYLENTGLISYRLEILNEKEKRYFGDISVVDFFNSYIKQTPTETINVEIPGQVTKPDNSKMLLKFILKNNRMFYVSGFDSTNRDPIEIRPYSIEKIKEIIDKAQQSSGIALKDHGELILVEGDSNSPYSSFKKLKDALKEKEINKFRIVTTAE